jgi:hypothetical protein
VLLAHFDKIAQHAIMLDLELGNAALLAVFAFQPRDHPPGFIAQAAHLIQRRMGARFHKATIAGQIRWLFHKQEFQAV